MRTLKARRIKHILICLRLCVFLFSLTPFIVGAADTADTESGLYNSEDTAASAPNAPDTPDTPNDNTAGNMPDSGGGLSVGASGVSDVPVGTPDDIPNTKERKDEFTDAEILADSEFDISAIIDGLNFEIHTERRWDTSTHTYLRQAKTVISFGGKEIVPEDIADGELIEIANTVGFGRSVSVYLRLFTNLKDMDIYGVLSDDRIQIGVAIIRISREEEPVGADVSEGTEEEPYTEDASGEPQETECL